MKKAKEKILRIFQSLFCKEKQENSKAPCETKSKLFTDEQIKMGWKVKSNK